MTKPNEKPAGGVAGRGRPRLGGGDRQSERRTLRVDPERWEAWRAAAEARGMKLSEWIRQNLDQAAGA